MALSGALFLEACAGGVAAPGPPEAPRPQRVARGEPEGAAAWARATPLIFATLDTSGDGLIEVREIEAALRDGAIDGLSPIPDIELQGLLANGDRNGDGQVDPMELSFFRTRVFVLLDRNRDGKLGASELVVADVVVGYAYRPRLPY